jgi:hypothetical protein
VSPRSLLVQLQLDTETLVTFLEKYFLKFNLSKVFFNVSLIGEVKAKSKEVKKNQTTLKSINKKL